MRKISYYLALVVLAGVGVISFWVYQKYFKEDATPIIAFAVSRGELHEAVSVRGEVAAQKEFNLEFPFGGIVERVAVKEGDRVAKGEVLMKLDTKDFEIERMRLSALLSQGEASLAKLLGGAQVEDIRVSEAKIDSATQALRDAQKTLLDAVRTSFTLADDAVRNKADQFFSNPRTSSVSFNQDIADSQLKTDLAALRGELEPLLLSWGNSLPQDITNISVDANHAEDNLTRVKSFLISLATAINSVSVSGSVSQTTLDTWKANILSARVAIDGAITKIVAAREKVEAAISAQALAQSELAFKKSKPRSEDVLIAEAQITQTKSMIAAVDEKIKKASLRAPGAGVVRKISIEEKEVFTPGMTALSFGSSGYKIQADVSELDISKVRYTNGSDAVLRFDAFPEKTFKGKVVFIEPKEVVKNEDIYFRTNIFLDEDTKGVELRSGMSADVVLYGVLKKDVLSIPLLAVEKRGGISFVNVAPGVKTKEEVDMNALVERQITTGISDGESVEVLSGLAEGEVVVLSSR